MRNSLCALLVLLCGSTVFADGIQYEQVTPTTQGWDKAGGPFCYSSEAAPTPKCLTLTTMGEIKLRVGGDWSKDPKDQAYINQLSDEAKQTAAQYNKLYVRYLATDSSRFMVHVFFLKDATPVGQTDVTQTIFASGAVNSASGGGVDVRVDSMSFSNPMEYLGAVLVATLGQPNAPKLTDKDLPRLDAAIVTNNLPLLEIGQEVAKAYLNSTK